MKNQQSAYVNPFTVISVFLVLTLLAMGDMLEVIPAFAPVVNTPLFPFYHETHDLLALIVAIYAAHQLSPLTGWRAIVWFVVIHLPYAYMVFPSESPELMRLMVLIVVAILGVRIITIRSRLEAQLTELASNLDVQRAAALQRAEELTILNKIATIGIEATSMEMLVENAIQVIDNVLHPDYFGIGLVDKGAGVLQVYRSTRTTSGDRVTIPVGTGVAGQVLTTGISRRIPDVSRDPLFHSVNPDAQSELCVPLKLGELVIGLINIESKRLDAFSEEDERLMTIFSGQLATAIEKVRLFQLAQRHAQEAETLRQAGAIVASTLKQNEAIK